MPTQAPPRVLPSAQSDGNILRKAGAPDLSGMERTVVAARPAVVARPKAPPPVPPPRRGPNGMGRSSTTVEAPTARVVTRQRNRQLEFMSAMPTLADSQKPTVGQGAVKVLPTVPAREPEAIQPPSEATQLPSEPAESPDEAKQEVRRKKIADEICSTEKTYCRSLQTIITVCCLCYEQERQREELTGDRTT